MPESATLPETGPAQTPTQTPKPAPTPSVDAAKPVVTAAVQRCCAAYQQALVASGGPKAIGARDAAEGAYRKNLPWLVDRDSIRAFVACITQGMVLGIFWNDEGPRLIVAAKAAFAAVPPELRSDPGPALRPDGTPARRGVGRPKSSERTG